MYSSSFTENKEKYAKKLIEYLIAHDKVTWVSLKELDDKPNIMFHIDLESDSGVPFTVTAKAPLGHMVRRLEKLTNKENLFLTSKVPFLELQEFVLNTGIDDLVSEKSKCDWVSVPQTDLPSGVGQVIYL